MKKWTLVLIGAIFMAVSTAIADTAGAEPPVNIVAYAFLLEHPTNNPPYVMNASNAAWAIHLGGRPQDSITDHKLHGSYISQPYDGYTNKYLWFGVRMWKKQQDYQMYPKFLSLQITTTDGLLNRSLNLGGATNYYGYSSIGVEWASFGNPGIGGTFNTGFWNDVGNDTDEFNFIGAPTKPFVYTNGVLTGFGSKQYIDDYIMSFSTDYKITATWTYNDGTNPVAHASITLHTKLLPGLGIVKTTVNTPGSKIDVSLFANVDDSWLLYRASTLKPVDTNGVAHPNWVFDSTMNGNDIFPRPATTNGYWKAELQ